MNYTLNMREVTYAMSEALDYVGIDDTMHGKRVAYMAAEIGKLLGWDDRRLDDIKMIGMLHDCGVSSTDVHLNLVNELDWENSHLHCERGAQLLGKVSIYHDFAQTILFHHTHWDMLPSTLPESTRVDANLIYLVDRVDALRVQVGDSSPAERSRIVETLKKYSGTMFSPELVEQFIAAAHADSFWLYMEAEPLNGYFEEWITQGAHDSVTFELLKQVAIMFADVVDAKSSFTNEHSYGVASLAGYLARQSGFSKESEETVILAALLHDLGKLRVADAILYKKGPLDEEERSKMNRHGFDSFMILRKIKGMNGIARIASLHHEYLDASGYPYQLGADTIPPEARVIAVADIFQALIQDRPYRSGLSALEALEVLEEMARVGKIDLDFVKLVAEHPDECYEYARHATL